MTDKCKDWANNRRIRLSCNNISFRVQNHFGSFTKALSLYSLHFSFLGNDEEMCVLFVQQKSSNLSRK